MSKKMHHLSIGNENFEVVDDSARSDLQILGARSTPYALLRSADPDKEDDRRYYFKELEGANNTQILNQTIGTVSGNVVSLVFTFNVTAIQFAALIYDRYYPAVGTGGQVVGRCVKTDDPADLSPDIPLQEVRVYFSDSLTLDNGHQGKGFYTTRQLEIGHSYTFYLNYICQGFEDTYEAEPDAIVLADGSVTEAKLSADVQGKIAQALGKGSGQPLPINLAEEMTDPEKIYLYTGSEEGYSYGHWYYFDEEWIDSGQYGIGVAGEDGKDGISPSVVVTEGENGVNIIVTDEEGTTEASIQNGTATDEQVDAWLTAHPEATTSVEDDSITPNKTTFIAEPYVYGTVVGKAIRGTITDSTGAFVNNSTASTGHTPYMPVDLTQGTSVKMAVSTGTINNRWVYLYKDGVFVARTNFTTTTNRGTINLSSYVTTDAETGEKTASVNQIAFVCSTYSATAYVSNSTETSDNTLANLTKTYFDFREGYKDDFYHALGLDDGGVTTESIADGAVTGKKFADESIEPRKLSTGTNLLDYANVITGKYLGANGILGGNAKQFIAWVPVESGKTYTVNFVPANFRFYGFFQSNKTTLATGWSVNAIVNAQSNSYDITVPTSANVAYMCLSGNDIATMYNYNIVPRMKVWETSYGEPSFEYTFDWLKLNDINKLRSSPFRGKVLLATGDSITENNTRNDNKSWCVYVREKLGFILYNDGKSGTGLAKRYSGNHSILYRVENEWDTDYSGITPDLILIMGNMNDGTGTGDGSTQSLNDLGISGWAANGVLAVGSESDGITTQSVYGCAKRFLEDVIAKYPLAKIGWILSTPRNQTISAWTGKTNCYGHGWFHDYAEAIKYQCQQYNVPVLDLYHESGFRPTNSTNMNTYMDDGTTHPNTAGIKKYMVDPIVKWIEANFGEVE